MAVVPVSYPGVYVLETSSGSVSISPVATSRTLFIGRTERGPLDVPTLVTSFTRFEAVFGSGPSVGELSDQVRQFFLNGGGQAIVMRVAHGALAASVEVENEFGTTALVFVAKDAGIVGNSIRLEVDYATARPEATFNLTVYRETIGAGGAPQQTEVELHRELDMNPGSSRYVVNVLHSESRLIAAQLPSTPPTPIRGFAAGGVLGVGAAPAAAEADLLAKIKTAINHAITLAGAGATSGSFEISVDEQPFVTVALPPTITGPNDLANRINAALSTLGTSVDVGLLLVGTSTAPAVALQVTSKATSASSSVRMRRAPGTTDIARELQLGEADGGIEVAGAAPLRPMANGVVARLATSAANLATLDALATLLQQDGAAVSGVKLTDGEGVIDVPFALTAGKLLFDGGTAGPSLGAARGTLDAVVGMLDTKLQAAPRRWLAGRSGFRITLRSTRDNADLGPEAVLTKLGAGTFDPTATNAYLEVTASPGRSANVKAYRSLPTSAPAQPFVTGTTQGSDGDKPTLADYDAAYAVVRRDVDLFNLLVLPRDAKQTDADRDPLWGPASAFCKRRRAVLLMDPRADGTTGWADANQATDAMRGGVRNGIVRDHTAIYWPRLKVRDARSGQERAIDPCGSVAGVCARIDATRGVWKAPAGLEASLVGVSAVEYRMSDDDNGLINPEALNAIRAFPNGIVVWGSRTMDGFDNSGNTDYRYLPVRRVALHIEESLYRGLAFAVFEPNDEPLWSQIRLAAGAFMNGLFREGAFQGRKASDAYFVKCDEETTTQTDRNLGIVNVIVGFAALRPAEFVVLTVKQLAGQVQS